MQMVTNPLTKRKTTRSRRPSGVLDRTSPRRAISDIDKGDNVPLSSIETIAPRQTCSESVLCQPQHTFLNLYYGGGDGRRTRVLATPAGRYPP